MACIGTQCRTKPEKLCEDTEPVPNFEMAALFYKIGTNQASQSRYRLKDFASSILSCDPTMSDFHRSFVFPKGEPRTLDETKSIDLLAELADRSRETTLIETTHFESEWTQEQKTPYDQEVLDLSKWLDSAPKNVRDSATYYVIGFASPEGENYYNLELSDRRARLYRQLLENELGAKGKVIHRGLGEIVTLRRENEQLDVSGDSHRSVAVIACRTPA